MEKQAPLIEVKGLKTYFYMWDGIVRAVDGVDFTIEQEKTLAFSLTFFPEQGF